MCHCAYLFKSSTVSSVPRTAAILKQLRIDADDVWVLPALFLGIDAKNIEPIIQEASYVATADGTFAPLLPGRISNIEGGGTRAALVAMVNPLTSIADFGRGMRLRHRAGMESHGKVFRKEAGTLVLSGFVGEKCNSALRRLVFIISG